MEIKKQIKPGLYLVVDPSLDKTILLHKLFVALQAPITAVQLWDNFEPGKNYFELVQCITSLCHEKNVPVLINNKWEWINKTNLDGVHFDAIPENFEHIKKEINKPFITGLTCNNDLSALHWANKNQLDYISFCSIFPSTTSNSCELVKFAIIRQAKTLTSMPIFLAGGIRPENMAQLNELDFDGVAVISGIMNSDRPDESIQQYLKQLSINKT